jgi:hypothetical protein
LFDSAHMAPVMVSPAAAVGTAGMIKSAVFGSSTLGRISSNADLLLENSLGQPKYTVSP